MGQLKDVVMQYVGLSASYLSSTYQSVMASIDINIILGVPKVILDESKELCFSSPKRMVGKCHMTLDSGYAVD